MFVHIFAIFFVGRAVDRKRYGEKCHSSAQVLRRSTNALWEEKINVNCYSKGQTDQWRKAHAEFREHKKRNEMEIRLFMRKIRCDGQIEHFHCNFATFFAQFTIYLFHFLCVSLVL